MDRNDVRKQAHAMGCPTGAMASLTETIRCIQRAQGHPPCFGALSPRDCARYLCPFRAECVVFTTGL